MEYCDEKWHNNSIRPYRNVMPYDSLLLQLRIIDVYIIRYINLQWVGSGRVKKSIINRNGCTVVY